LGGEQVLSRELVEDQARTFPNPDQLEYPGEVNERKISGDYLGKVRS